MLPRRPLTPRVARAWWETIGENGEAFFLLFLGAIVFGPIGPVVLILTVAGTLTVAVVCDAVAIIASSIFLVIRAPFSFAGRQWQDARNRRFLRQCVARQREELRQRPIREAEERRRKVAEAEARYRSDLEIARSFTDRSEREAFTQGAKNRHRARLLQIAES